MARFCLAVFAYTSIATALWWTTASLTAPLTIAAAKWFHGLAGAPAPYLILEVLDYWWLAPPVQLFVGLTLASRWTAWSRRLRDLLIGVAVLFYIVVMDVIVMASPYLGPSNARIVLGNVLTKGHLIVTPIIVWLMLTDLSPAALFLGAPAKPAASKRRGAAQPARRGWPRPLCTAAICLVPPLMLYGLTVRAPAEVSEARRALAAALASGDDRLSILRALELNKVQRERLRAEDQRLYYLLGRLAERFGDETLARKSHFHASVNPKVQMAVRKERQARRPKRVTTLPAPRPRP